jgi:hypothetical protein
MPLIGFSSGKPDPSAIRFFQQGTAPNNAKLGDRWLNTNNMNEFIYLKVSDDPETYQWFDLSGDYPGDSIS